MSSLTLTVLKLGFLALLWLFVLSAFSVVRSDLFGTKSARAALGSQATTGSRRNRRRARAGGGRAARNRSRAQARVARVVEGPDAGLTAVLDGSEVTIGRGPGNTLALSDDYVSTAHARIIFRDGAWLVEDLGSTNGTHVDGARLRAPVLLPIGTPVRVGKTVIELQTG